MTGKNGVRNKTRKTVLASGYKLCISIRSKARGLMFTNQESVMKNALIFIFDRPRVQSLHMFFVFYPIDVLFLDGNRRVVDVRERFRPFTVYNSSKRSQFVIELPSGTIAKSKTKMGDEISWK